MEWETTTKSQTNINVNGKVFNIICETDPDGDLALIINGEYICDVDELPTHEELIEYVNQQTTLNEMANMAFARRIS